MKLEYGQSDGIWGGLEKDKKGMGLARVFSIACAMSYER